jgi:hypothetical protein
MEKLGSAVHSTWAQVITDPTGKLDINGTGYLPSMVGASSVLATILAVEFIDGVHSAYPHSQVIDPTLYCDTAHTYDGMVPLYWVDCGDEEGEYWVYGADIIVYASSGEPYALLLAA